MKKKKNSTPSASTGYGTRQPGPPNLTARTGPLIQVVITVPVDAEAAYKSANLESPYTVGYMLIDTGAVHTAVEEDVIRALGLPEIGEAGAVHPASGARGLSLYKARLIIPYFDNKGKELQLGEDLPVVNMANISNSPDFQHLRDKDNRHPIKVIGLIGRSYLQFVRFIYDGPSGTYQLIVNEDAVKS